MTCSKCGKEASDLRSGVCFECAEKAEKASAAAAELGKRKAEVEAARKTDAGTPVAMVDLHDLRTELLGELKRTRDERVPHAVPPAPAAPAQKRGRGMLGGVLGGVLVVVVVVVLAAFAGRHK